MSWRSPWGFTWRSLVGRDDQDLLTNINSIGGRDTVPRSDLTVVIAVAPGYGIKGVAGLDDMGDKVTVRTNRPHLTAASQNSCGGRDYQ